MGRHFIGDWVCKKDCYPCNDPIDPWLSKLLNQDKNAQNQDDKAQQ